MEEKSKRFRNLYKKQEGPELVSEEDIKKALRLRENRTDRTLYKKEIELQKRKMGLDKRSTKNDRERDD